MVGAVRFELTTSCTRNKRATRLRYAPNRVENLPVACHKCNDHLFPELAKKIFFGRFEQDKLVTTNRELLNVGQARTSAILSIKSVRRVQAAAQLPDLVSLRKHRPRRQQRAQH